MKATVSFKKLIWGMAGAFSMLAAANHFSNQALFSNSFMKNEEVVFVSNIDESQDRGVASSFKKSKRKIAVYPIGFEGAGQVNGDWEVVRIINAKGLPVYDKINGLTGGNEFVKIDLELVARSTVRVSNDDSQIYKISELTKKGTIALFKSFEGSYEILEARRIRKFEERELKEEFVNTEVKEEEQIVKSLIVETERELVLRQVSDPVNAKTVMGIDMVDGKVEVTRGMISVKNVTLNHKDAYKGVINFDAELGDAGVFKTEILVNGEEVKVSGNVSNYAQGGVMVRFANGPLQGATMHFVSEDKWQTEMDKFEERMSEMEIPSNNESDKIEQSEGTREIANEVEEKEQVEEKELSDDEVAQITLKKGFSFGASPKREVASVK